MKIRNKITEFCRRAGYRPEFLSFVPISAWSGDNLFEGSANIPWYHGPTLIEKLDQIELPKRYSEHPLRLSVQHVYNIQGVGTVAFGKIHIGVLRSGMDLTIAPTGVKTTVSSIEIHHVPLE